MSRAPFCDPEPAHYATTALESGGRFYFQDEIGSRRDVTLGQEGQAMNVQQLSMALSNALSPALVAREAMYMGVLDHPREGISDHREIILHFAVII